MATKILTRIIPLCLFLAMLWIPVRAQEIPKIAGGWFDQSSHGFTMSQDGLQVTLNTRSGREFTGTLSGEGNATFQVFHKLTYEETSLHLPPKVRQKIVADGRQVSIIGTVSADAQTINGEYRDEEVDWEVESGEFTATYTQIPHPITLTRMCDDGKTRTPEKPAKKTKTWQLPDPSGEVSVKLTNTGGHGEYAVKGSEKALETVSKIIEKIADKVEEVPGGEIMKIPMKYFEKITEIGGQITEAGKSISEKTAKAFDLDVEIPIINRTVTCVQTEICRDGQWKPYKWKPYKMKEPTPPWQDQKSMIKLPRGEALTLEEVGKVLDSDVPRVEERLKKNQKAFDADPCQGVEIESPPQPPVTREKTECDKLREALAKIEPKRRKVHQEIEIVSLKLDKVKRDWSNSSAGLFDDLKGANTKLEKDQNELKQAKNHLETIESGKDNIINNTSKAHYAEVLESSKERVAKAEQAVTQATGTRNGIQKQINDKKSAIRNGEENLKKSELGLDLIDAEEARLKKELEKCQ